MDRSVERKAARMHSNILRIMTCAKKGDVPVLRNKNLPLLATVYASMRYYPEEWMAFCELENNKHLHMDSPEHHSNIVLEDFKDYFIRRGGRRSEEDWNGLVPDCTNYFTIRGGSGQHFRAYSAISEFMFLRSSKNSLLLLYLFIGRFLLLICLNVSIELHISTVVASISLEIRDARSLVRIILFPKRK